MLVKIEGIKLTASLDETYLDVLIKLLLLLTYTGVVTSKLGSNMVKKVPFLPWKPKLVHFYFIDADKEGREELY